MHFKRVVKWGLDMYQNQRIKNKIICAGSFAHMRFQKPECAEKNRRLGKLVLTIFLLSSKL